MSNTIQESQKKEQSNQRKRDQKKPSNREGTGVSARITSVNESDSDPSTMLINKLTDLNEDLPSKSRLDQNEISLMSRILVIATRYGNRDAEKNAGVQIVFTIMKLKVGLKGLGRKELVQLGEGAYRASAAKHAEESKEIKL